MGHVRDESLIFSLHTLQELERERIEREEAERAARHKARQLSLEEEERLHREAEARRARAELARKREEALRRKEEDARLSAMREALVERARVEADWKGRLELQTRERAHAERMAELEIASARRRGRLLIALTVAIGVLGGTGVLLLQTRLQEATRLFHEQASTLELERESRQRVGRLLELSERRLAAMSAERPEGIEASEGTSESSSRAQPSEAGTSSSSVTPPRGSAKARPAASRKPAQRSPSRVPECGSDGDPLNGCLPKG